MNIPKNLLYTKEHEWARLEGKKAYIGITDYAQGSLGDITFVGLPKAGDTITRADPCATVESVKAASDIYAPFSGKVAGLNENLSNHPELVNKSPYEEGYCFVMDISDESEKEKLMSADAYKIYLDGVSK
jgi:glycine cleavage system H protein